MVIDKPVLRFAFSFMWYIQASTVIVKKTDLEMLTYLYFSAPLNMKKWFGNAVSVYARLHIPMEHKYTSLAPKWLKTF
jgi:hypothetical protein